MLLITENLMLFDLIFNNVVKPVTISIDAIAIILGFAPRYKHSAVSTYTSFVRSPLKFYL